MGPRTDSEREKLTIPDLELMDMALGARNAQYIADNLGIAHSALYLWSDSMINFQRVVTPWKQKQLWTENRLTEIRNFQEALNIRLRHVRTDQNPADIVSRGIPASELQGSHLWWHGAPFLLCPDTEWPLQPEILPLDTNALDTPVKEGSSESTTLVYLESFSATTSSAKPLVDLERTNDYQKLLRLHARPSSSAVLRLARSVANSATLYAMSFSAAAQQSIWRAASPLSSLHGPRESPTATSQRRYRARPTSRRPPPPPGRRIKGAKRTTPRQSAGCGRRSLRTLEKSVRCPGLPRPLHSSGGSPMAWHLSQPFRGPPSLHTLENGT